MTSPNAASSGHDPRLSELQRTADAAPGVATLAGLQRTASLASGFGLPPKSSGRPPVTQRAGDFSGMMIAHERQGGSAEYALGTKKHERDGSGLHKLTYHHIVPEGKLKRLGKLVMRFEFLFGAENSDTDQIATKRDDIETRAAEIRRLVAEIDTRETDIRLADAEVSRGEAAAKSKRGVESREGKTIAKQKADARGWTALIDAARVATDRIAELRREIASLKAEIAPLKEEINGIEAEIAAIVEKNALTEDEKAILAAPSGPGEDGRTGSGDQSREAFLKAQIEELVASSRAQAEAVKADQIEEMRASGNDRQIARIGRFEAQDVRANISSDYKGSMGFGAIAWIPGNIHEGPSSRLSPGDDNFDASRDDGGSGFESSARELIHADQFAALETLSTMLDAFEDTPALAFDATRIDQFIDLIHRINRFRETYPDMREFDASEWEQVKSDGAGRVRGNRTSGAPQGDPAFDKAAIVPRAERA